MAKPKRFTQAEFILLLDTCIEEAMIKNLTFFDCEVSGDKKDIQVASLADNFGVNVATFRRWCVEYTKCSPKKYLDNYRIEKAKQLLRQGLRSGVVAKQLGYVEHKTFCEVFSRNLTSRG